MPQIVKQKNKNKFGSFHFIVWGFNSIAGFSFLITLGTIFSKVGNYFILIFIISGIMAIGITFLFGKLAKYYGKNGGSLYYINKGFNEKGAIIGFFQMIQNPLFSSIIPLAFVWIFTGVGLHSVTNDLSKEFYIFIIGFVIFLFISLIPLWGFTPANLSLYILWSMKWLILLIVFVLCCFRLQYFINNIFHNHYKPSNFNYFSIITSTMIFFFSFSGVESMSAISEDLENPKKNILKTIITVGIIILLFYFLYYYFILGVLGVKLLPVPGKNNSNPLNLIFKSFGYTLTWGNGGINSLVIILLIIGQIGNKFSARSADAWENSRIISAFAKLEYIPKKFSNKNKKGILYNALITDIIVTVILIIIFLIGNYFSIIRLDEIMESATYITMIIYIFSFLAFFKIQKINPDFKKQITLTNNIYIFMVFCLLIFIWINYNIFIIIKLIQHFQHPNNPAYKNAFQMLIPVIITIIVYIFGKIILRNNNKEFI